MSQDIRPISENALSDTLANHSVGVSKPIKLSPYSKTFYNEWKLDSNRSDYNLVFDQSFRGEINFPRLQRALKRFTKDYFILHSNVKEKDNDYYWVENHNAEAEITYYESEPDELTLLKYVQTPFNLGNGSLFRAALIKVSDDHFRFIIVIHHIALDGSKVDFFVDAISNYYNDQNYSCTIAIENQCDRLSQLSDSLEKQLQANKEKHQNFWREKLEEATKIDLLFLKPLLPVEAIPTSQPNNFMGTYRFNFDTEVLQQVKQLREQYDITPYLFGQLVFAFLLYRHTGQDKIIISYPIRIKAGLDFIYGAHVNTSVMIYQFDSSMSLGQFLAGFKKYFDEIKKNKYSHYPVNSMMSNTENKNILDVSFVQTNMLDEPFYFNGIKSIIVNHLLDIDLPTKLSFDQEIKNHVLTYRIKYHKKYIDPALLLNFIDTYKRIFMELLADLINQQLNVPLSKYMMVSQEQYQLIINKWNNTEVDYPKDKTVHQLFEEQVLKTPNNIALVCEEVTLTYAELNDRANQLAHYLIHQHQIKPSNFIALFLERNQHMLISILAVLKAGCAYVPIDPSCPDERITYILEDTKAKMLLINQVHANKLNAQSDTEAIDVLIIDSKSLENILINQATVNPNTAVTGCNLMYVIYTSGTTGKPKGVMVEHHSVNNVLMSLYDVYQVKENKKIAAYTNYVFDVSVSEFFTPLTAGAELHLLDSVRKDINKLSAYLNQKKINVAYLPPAILSILPQINYPTLKALIFAGEPCSQAIGRYWLTQCKLYNYYGPTEATIYATGKQVVARNVNEIGQPIANTQVYVLDQNLNPLPIGAVGELYIGGVGLARGYLNQPELTHKRFICNPFVTTKGLAKNITRMYQTGDLVRWLPDGQLEYLGRNDSQVKLRGYRIELSEIESVFLTYPGIQQSVVLLESENNNKYLIGYYVGKVKLDEENIKNYLAQYLPDYMIPAMLFYLEKLPLNANGKLDKKILSYFLPKNICEYVAPHNEQEKIICETFAKVLNLEAVGIDDNFFKVGGDSINAISLVAKLQRYFKINIADIFNLKTPRKIVSQLIFIKNNSSKQLEKIKSVYQVKNSFCISNSGQQKKLHDYRASIKQLTKHYHKKPIVNILLTGATGYLGCNLLNELLTETDYKIFLLVRSETPEIGFNRINEKFQFYFNKTLEIFRDQRVFIFSGDLEEIELGLSKVVYQKLVTNIDSIFHSAALTKHYGEYDKFYLANVQATINLLELCNLTRLKDFHYISTISVLNPDCFHANEQIFFTEDDYTNNTDSNLSVYIKTKAESERQVMLYQHKGINANIYRIGNLAFIAANHKTQENIGDNAFCNRLACLAHLKIASKEIGIQEISPVDLTAKALIKLFDKKELDNGIYHVFNPHPYDIVKFLYEQDATFKILPIDEFIDKMLICLNCPSYQRLVERFLLHQGWLEGETDISTATQIFQEKTGAILEALEFTWQPIQDGMFKKFFDNAMLIIGEIN